MLPICISGHEREENSEENYKESVLLPHAESENLLRVTGCQSPGLQCRAQEWRGDFLQAVVSVRHSNATDFSSTANQKLRDLESSSL